MPATLRLLLALTLVLTSTAATAWQTLTSNLDMYCSQAAGPQLDCSYRLLIPEPPMSIDARYHRQTLPVGDRQTYPWPGAITAVLFLVDTSDPAREVVVKRNLNQIKGILDKIKPYYRVGLASFDKDLKIEAPIGSDKESILKAASALRATGLTTELYRNTIKAIDLLGDIKADRKVILLFSDGQAEDKAYFHQDVIRAARKHHVIINTLGYPRTVALSVALQTLRRLSEESGGVYTEAGNDYRLPEAFLKMPFDNVDRGGRFRVNLKPLTGLAAARADVQLVFGTDLGDIKVDVPANLPAPAVARTSTAPAPHAAPVQIVTTPSGQEEDVLDTWLWYGVPVALLILIGLTGVTLVLLTRKQAPVKQDKQHQPVQEQFKPYAYLIAQDEKGTRFPITRTTWRIGRSRDNEMTLDDNSVSRRHAEIQRLASGKFMLYDLDSLNGIYVNDEKVSKYKLSEGDIIEIGDFYLRFTQHPSDFQLSEETAVLKTRAPYH
jgi:hypothetical protein